MLTQWAHFRLFRARSSPLLSKNLTHACERFLRPHTPVSRGSLRWSTPGGRVADKEKHAAPAQTTREVDIRPDTWQTALLPWGKNFSPGKTRGHGWRKRLFSSPGDGVAQVTACAGYMRTRAPLHPSGGTRSDFSGRLKHGFFTANLPGIGIH